MKRYDPYCVCDQGFEYTGSMKPDEDGDYILYSDFERYKESKAQNMAALSRKCEKYREALEEVRNKTAPNGQVTGWLHEIAVKALKEE